ncbi:hypothetical protein D1007_00882 [Hordeum vulgare]|nr:hypothetical protein D1007_00882 [Hordeum vulgare]
MALATPAGSADPLTVDWSWRWTRIHPAAYAPPPPWLASLARLHSSGPVRPTLPRLCCLPLWPRLGRLAPLGGYRLQHGCGPDVLPRCRSPLTWPPCSRLCLCRLLGAHQTTSSHAQQSNSIGRPPRNPLSPCYACMRIQSTGIQGEAVLRLVLDNQS